jgi:exodeoxyribonuclease VII large subunit
MSRFEFLPPAGCSRPYTISEINEGIAATIESSNTLVWIEGEISNWKGGGASGHCYFRLKDSNSQVPAVLWRTSAAQLTFKPEDGMAVLAIASIRVYAKGGYYQLDVHRMQPLGAGALFLAYEKLKKRLESEGLFDSSFKKPLPSSVKTLGVITSAQGAVIRDIARVVLSRSPQTDILLIDVPVQGEKAASEIAKAIRRMNDYGKVDCMIVGRGGGSIEDLQAFNEEIVARAIFDSTIPVISAVGHETDFTIADFVADIRAATPSAGAEIAIRDSREYKTDFEKIAQRFANVSRRYFSNVKIRFDNITNDSAWRIPVSMLRDSIQSLDIAGDQFRAGMYHYFEKATARMRTAGARLNALSPLSVLSRGYAVVAKDTGASVRDVTELVVDEKVTITFSKGSARAKIESLG